MDFKKWYIHTIEYYSAAKRNELAISAPTWANLKCYAKEKTTHCMISFVRKFVQKQNYSESILVMLLD